MIVEFLSLVTAFCNACVAASVKKGLRDSNILSATLISTFINMLLLWIVFLSLYSWSFQMEAILIFAIAGILVVLGRVFNFSGIERLGVSVNQPIIGSSSLFGAITSWIVLGESFSLPVYIGIILVVSGIVFISRKNNQGGVGGWKKASLTYPLMAAILYGISKTTSKVGLNLLNIPILGSMVSTSAALTFYSLFLALSGGIKKLSFSKRGVKFFAVAGLFFGLAWISFNFALSMGNATVVATLSSTTPLFSLILSRLFLRESLTINKFLGAVLIVSGVILISIF